MRHEMKKYTVFKNGVREYQYLRNNYMGGVLQCWYDNGCRPKRNRRNADEAQPLAGSRCLGADNNARQRHGAPKRRRLRPAAGAYRRQATDRIRGFGVVFVL